MRLATVLALVLLVGCAPASAPLDASRPADGFVAPLPVCRPLSEDPGCRGDCSGFQARCPAGYTARCGSLDGTLRWSRPDGRCFIAYAYGAECLDGERVECPVEAPAAVCVPPSPSLGCPD